VYTILWEVNKLVIVIYKALESLFLRAHIWDGSEIHGKECGARDIVEQVW
jgi:hypothetical protein